MASTLCLSISSRPEGTRLFAFQKKSMMTFDKEENITELSLKENAGMKYQCGEKILSRAIHVLTKMPPQIKSEHHSKSVIPIISYLQTFFVKSGSAFNKTKSCKFIGLDKWRNSDLDFTLKLAKDTGVSMNWIKITLWGKITLFAQNCIWAYSYSMYAVCLRRSYTAIKLTLLYAGSHWWLTWWSAYHISRLSAYWNSLGLNPSWARHCSSPQPFLSLFTVIKKT